MPEGCCFPAFFCFFSRERCVPAPMCSRQPEHHSYLRPPFLRPGDTVSVVAVSSKLPKKVDTSFIRTIASWGLTVIGRTPFSAGTAVGLPEPTGSVPVICSGHSMIPPSGAVIFYKGGYGAVRTLDDLDLKVLRKHPKWLAGFSDVTVCIRRCGRWVWNRSTAQCPSCSEPIP